MGVFARLDRLSKEGLVSVSEREKRERPAESSGLNAYMLCTLDATGCVISMTM